MVAGILESMRWLGLDWDEGPEVGGPHAPYFQSQRFDRHREIGHKLLADGHAYKCYCSPELLTQKREEAEKQGGGWKYDRRCLQLSDQERQQLEESGVAPATRFKIPPGKTSYKDHVRGDIEFDHEQIEDFVILRSNGLPTYHLSVVADDVDMRISHVIRGDDHISNTPKHILLWRALGQTPPEFAHIPLILGTDKKRLSKRHGATSVTEYERLGYLPEAMVNFLGLLGWSPGGDRELMTRDELIAAFTLDGISGGDAVFNPEKLDWFNGQYLAQPDAGRSPAACQAAVGGGRSMVGRIRGGAARVAAACSEARDAACAAPARLRRAGSPVSGGDGRVRPRGRTEAFNAGGSRPAC